MFKVVIQQVLVTLAFKDVVDKDDDYILRDTHVLMISTASGWGFENTLTLNITQKVLVTLCSHLLLEGYD